jgi:type 1 glutamine amidotransferase
LGIVAWHGFASAFLNCRRHKLMLGGQFVAHPGDGSVKYDIHFHNNDPLVHGLEDFTLTSEQYYMLIDPAVKVMASTIIRGADMPWLAGVRMPVAWTRRWGEGRVFYCGLGHTIGDLSHRSIVTLLHRAAHWASQSVTPGIPLR